MNPESLVKLDSLIEEVENKLDTYDKKNIVVVLGPPGSGKSTYINSIKKDGMYNNYVHTSIDDYIPDKYLGKVDPYELYKEARKIGILFTDYLLENNISMIIEGTGQNLDMAEYLKRLKNVGYNISIHILNTTLDNCISRVRERNINKKRQVKLRDVEKAFNLLEVNKPLLIEHADSVIEVDKN